MKLFFKSLIFLNYFLFFIKKYTFLENSPQVKAIVLKVRIVTPKKPNSARRPVIKVSLVNKNFLIAHIPGIGHNLRKHCLVLIRYGRVRDLPGIYYKSIRGVFDLSAVLNRVSRRSIYGIKQSDLILKKVRRKFRRT